LLGFAFGQADRPSLATALLESLLGEIRIAQTTQPMDGIDSDGRESAIAKLIQRLSEDPSQDCDFEAQAARAHLSPSQFRRRFVRMVGRPPRQWLIRQRLSAAAVRLRGTTQTVQAVAEAVGFADHRHFTKSFTRRFGVPPSHYRLMSRGLGAEPPE
jgi:transcriptional regulator GlxA family with amidase domain